MKSGSLANVKVSRQDSDEEDDDPSVADELDEYISLRSPFVVDDDTIKADNRPEQIKSDDNISENFAKKKLDNTEESLDIVRERTESIEIDTDDVDGIVIDEKGRRYFIGVRYLKWVMENGISMVRLWFGLLENILRP